MRADCQTRAAEESHMFRFVVPSVADHAIAQHAFDRVVEDWAGTDVEKHRQLALLLA